MGRVSQVHRGLVFHSLVIAFFQVLGVATAFGFNVVLLFKFGVGRQADAFFSALAIPRVAFSILPWICNTVLVPAFTDSLEVEERSSTWRFFSMTVNAVALGLTILVLVGVISSTQLSRLVSPGFDARLQQDVAQMLCILCLAIVPLGGFEVIRALLNAQNHFAAPAAMLCIRYTIATVVLLVESSKRVQIAAWGLLLGMCLQGVPMAFVLWKKRVRYRVIVRHDARRLAQVFRLAKWSSTGFLVRQSVAVVSQSLASFLPQGTVSALGYAFQIVSVAQRTISGSIATSLLPKLSRESCDKSSLYRTLLLGIRLTGVTLIPAMTLLVIHAKAVADVVSSSGEAIGSADLVALFLVLYGASVPLQGLVLTLRSPYYAVLDSRTPSLQMLLESGFYVLSTVLLFQFIRGPGIALAFSLTYLFAALVALWALRGIIFELRAELVRFVGQVLAADALLAMSTWFASSFAGLYIGDQSLVSVVSQIMVSVIIGLVVYAISAWFLGIEEVKTIARSVVLRFRIQA